MRNGKTRARVVKQERPNSFVSPNNFTHLDREKASGGRKRQQRTAVVAGIPTSAAGRKKVVEIKTQRNYVYEPRGCDNITAGRRVARAKNSRTREEIQKRGRRKKEGSEDEGGRRRQSCYKNWTAALTAGM